MKHIQISLCVCVCVCVEEEEGGLRVGWKQRGKRGREVEENVWFAFLCVCVCVCFHFNAETLGRFPDKSEGVEYVVDVRILSPKMKNSSKSSCGCESQNKAQTNNLLLWFPCYLHAPHFSVVHHSTEHPTHNYIIVKIPTTVNQLHRVMLGHIRMFCDVGNDFYPLGKESAHLISA